MYSTTADNTCFTAHFVRPNAFSSLQTRETTSKIRVAFDKHASVHPTSIRAHPIARPPAHGFPAIHCGVGRLGLRETDMVYARGRGGSCGRKGFVGCVG